MKVYSWVILILGILSHNDICGQEYFPKHQLIDDINDLYYHVRELHPDPFFNISQHEFENRLDAIKTALPDSLTPLGLYSYIAPLIVSLGDAHTLINSPVKHFFEENPFVLPFDYSLDKKDLNLYVTNNLENNIPIGAKIIDINGVPAQQIVNDILSYATGEMLGYKVYYANRFLPLLLSLSIRSSDYDITYAIDGRLCDTTLAAGKYDMTYTSGLDRQKVARSKPEDCYTFSKIDENAVLLKINYFFNYGSVMDSMINFIHKEKIDNLIIDLRDTHGGISSYPAMVLMRFATSRFKIADKIHYKITDLHRKYNVTREHKQNGHFTEKQKKMVVMKNPTTRFDGNVYVLTSNKTFSAGVLFANVVKKYGYGTIIGETTGGNISVFGWAIDCQLPNTRLKYQVASVEYIQPEGRIRHGVYPDIEVPAEQALDKAIEEIRRNYSID